MDVRAQVERWVEHLPPGRRQRVFEARRELRAYAADRPLAVLDAGCEYGALSLSLAAAEPAWTLHGVDVRADAVERASAEAAARGLTNVTLDVVDLTAPWSGPQYDAVACLECLFEIPDHGAALATMRPGGLLLAQVPTADWRLLTAWGQKSWGRDARRGYGEQELRELVEHAGFVDVSVRPTFRGVARLAQEVVDRFQSSSLKVRAALLPPAATAAWLDSHGVTGGSPRSWWLTARRAAE